MTLNRVPLGVWFSQIVARIDPIRISCAGCCFDFAIVHLQVQKEVVMSASSTRAKHDMRLGSLRSADSTYRSQPRRAGDEQIERPRRLHRLMQTEPGMRNGFLWPIGVTSAGGSRLRFEAEVAILAARFRQTVTYPAGSI